VIIDVANIQEFLKFCNFIIFFLYFLDQLVFEVKQIIHSQNFFKTTLHLYYISIRCYQIIVHSQIL